MKKRFSLVVVFALAICVSNAFAQSTMNQDNKTMSQNKSMAQDSKFMTQAAMGNMDEIAMGNLAVSKSQNDDVKRFGQMMVDDHGRANDELKTVAMSKNVVLPTNIDTKATAAMDKLSGMSGDTFDKAYMKMMVKDHQKDIKMYQKEASGGKDVDAKAFASKTLPTLQSHLNMAQNINGKMMNNNKMANNNTNSK